MGAARGLGGRDLVRKHQASWPGGSFLAGLERQALDELVAERQGIRFPAGKAILVEGEPPGDVFLLLDAVVKVTARLGKGTALLAVRVGGDIVGEMAVADGGARSATVTATRGDLVVAVPGDEFLAVVGRYPAAGKVLAAQLSRKLRAANRRRVDFTAYKVPERVARVLLELAEDYGRPELSRPTVLTLRIGITQREFATLVGAAESTVHEVLAGLEARNILTWHYRAVEIHDVEVLRLACSGGELG